MPSTAVADWRSDAGAWPVVSARFCAVILNSETISGCFAKCSKNTLSFDFFRAERVLELRIKVQEEGRRKEDRRFIFQLRASGYLTGAPF